MSVTPIAKIPPEILRLVFITAFRDLNIIDEAAKFAKILCNVSSHWRSIATATSELWSTIFVGATKDLEGLERSLKYSTEHPLDIYIMTLADDGYPSNEADIVHTAMHLLVGHINRWRVLWVEVALLDSIRAIFWNSLGRGNEAPFLQTLSLLVCERRVDVGQVLAGIQIFTAPRLHCLQLHSSALNACFATFADSWSSVKELGVTVSIRDDIATFFSMLERFPGLQTLTIQQHDTYTGILAFNGSSLSPVSLPSLTTVSFTQMPGPYIEHFFRRSSAPKLTTLSLDFQCYIPATVAIEGSIIDALASINSSGRFPLLCNVVLASRSAYCPENFMSVMDFCTHLTLRSCLESAMFEPLARRFPQLKWLDLVPPRDYWCNIEAVLQEIVQERLTRGAPLQKLWIGPGVLAPMQNPTWFKQNIEEFRWIGHQS